MPLVKQRVPRPWLAFVAMFAIMSVLGPYDLHYRANHEEGVSLRAALSENGAGIEEGHPGRRFATVGLFLFALVLARRARRRDADLRDTPQQHDSSIAVPIIAFVVLAIASVAWAEDSPLALRRVVVFTTVCFAAWAIGREWKFSDILLFSILSCGVTLVASLGLEIMRGAFHPAEGMYRLSGLTHPNNHAKECGLLVLASLAAARLEPEHRRGYLLAAVGGCAVLFLTRSRTTALGLAAALGCGALYTVPRRQLVAIALPSLAAVVIVGVFGLDALESIRHALLFGRAASTADVGTLTGRTQLWSELLTYVRIRPLLGYGFGAFWTAEHTADVSLALGWAVPHAHNGYLEIVLELGVVGLSLFVTTFVAAVVHAVRQLHVNHEDVEALFTLCLLTWATITMVGETVVPQTQYAAFIAMTFLAREARTAQARVAGGAYAPAISHVA